MFMVIIKSNFYHLLHKFQKYVKGRLLAVAENVVVSEETEFGWDIFFENNEVEVKKTISLQTKDMIKTSQI